MLLKVPAKETLFPYRLTKPIREINFKQICFKMLLKVPAKETPFPYRLTKPIRETNFKPTM